MRKIFISTLLVLALTACLPVIEFQSNGLPDGGIIYLPLPAGVTEGGAESAESRASSEYLAKRLAYYIEAETQFRAVLDEVFLPPGTLAERKAAAFAAAEAAGANYAMLVKLGEYSDARSMSFRPDSLTVNEIRIFDVSNGDMVFGLKRPYEKATSNMNSLNRALDGLAADTAKNISKYSGT